MNIKNNSRNRDNRENDNGVKCVAVPYANYCCDHQYEHKNIHERFNDFLPERDAVDFDAIAAIRSEPFVRFPARESFEP